MLLTLSWVSFDQGEVLLFLFSFFMSLHLVECYLLTPKLHTQMRTHSIIEYCSFFPYRNLWCPTVIYLYCLTMYVNMILLLWCFLKNSTDSIFFFFLRLTYSSKTLLRYFQDTGNQTTSRHFLLLFLDVHIFMVCKVGWQFNIPLYVLIIFFSDIFRYHWAQ